MRGDPDYDERIGELYHDERRRTQRSHRLLKVIVATLVVLSVIVALFVDLPQPTRVAVVPYFIGLGLLKHFDPHWQTWNLRFTLTMALALPVAVLLRMVFRLMS